jgi:hypothetical protein
MKRTAISRKLFNAKRRGFLRTLAATTAALAAARCGGRRVAATAPRRLRAGPGPRAGPGAGAGRQCCRRSGRRSRPWRFTQGVASSFSLASFVSDANGDALAITMNAVTLPAGVTFDAANKRLVYNGIGAVASVNGVQMTADDGRP